MKKTASTYKTEWDFSEIYSGLNDKNLEADVAAIEKAHTLFAKKYSKREDYLTDENKLSIALKDYEKLLEQIGSTKPLWYLYNMQAIDSQNQTITALLGKFEPRITKAGNLTLFFTLKLGKIDRKLQSTFLKSPLLKHYRYFLKQIFETSKYDLSEPEEKILSLKSRTARDMWSESFSKLLAKQTVRHAGKDVPMGSALNLIQQLPLKERHELHTACMKVLKDISYFAESEINAIYSDKKVNDELRGFKEPYSATILGYQNEEKSVMALVDAVTEGFSISNRFYKLKAKLLGLKSLRYADRGVGIGQNVKEIKFDQCLDIVREGFRDVKKEYSDQLDYMLQTGKIDVYSKKGKQGGAYCWGGSGVPTVVFLNYVPSLDAVMTLAHEMGHAIHSELSKKPSIIYQHYTISVAEVASTFFENLAFEKVFATLTPQEQIVALHDRIQDYISTVFRQIACFNFELDIHRMIREKGAVTEKELCKLHNKHMSAYIGPIAKLNEDDGYFFTAWSHIRRFFYVYSYAYGALISRALYTKYVEDNSYIEKVNSFMEAGCTMSPEDIFKSVGIDTSKPEFFKEGLKSIEADIIRLEKLAKAAKMIK